MASRTEKIQRMTYQHGNLAPRVRPRRSHAPADLVTDGPRSAAASPADHCSGVNRYPMPDSVMKYRGLVGSGSSFRRSCDM